MDSIFQFLESDTMIKVVIGIFWAILFLQSGLDKVFDWSGNLSWLKGHFSKSFLASLVTPMLATLTLVEIAAGAVSLIGAIQVLVYGDSSLLLLGLALSILSLIMLFFGQRIAKDYPGAQSIAIYFGIALLSFLFLK
jgi:hypothetical protein